MFAQILIAVDGSENSQRACEAGATLAKAYDAVITVIHAIPSPSIYIGPLADEEFHNRVDKEAKKLVEEAASVIEKQDNLNVRKETVQARTSIVQAILDYASSARSDLIVCGTRGVGGLKRMAIGSVSSGLVTHASCPVLVVRRGGKRGAFRRILVAVDGSEHAKRAVAVAVNLAKALQAEELTALHIMTLPWAAYSGDVAIPMEKIEEGLRELAERATGEAEAMGQKEGIKVKPATEEEVESPVRAITSYASSENVDLIVMGTRGLGGLKRLLLGSVASGVVTYSGCSVLVVR